MQRTMKKIVGVLALSLSLVPALAFASVGITLSGGNPDSVRVGTTYSDPGYSANSSFDGDITGSVSFSGVNTSVRGTTVRTYTVTDSNGDTATASRTVLVWGDGGSTQPYCSGPTAPGWRTDLPGGGCGGTAHWFPTGSTYVSKGVTYTCDITNGPFGCIVE